MGTRSFTSIGGKVGRAIASGPRPRPTPPAPARPPPDRPLPGRPAGQPSRPARPGEAATRAGTTTTNRANSKGDIGADYFRVPSIPTRDPHIITNLIKHISHAENLSRLIVNVASIPAVGVPLIP